MPITDKWNTLRRWLARKLSELKGILLGDDVKEKDRTIHFLEMLQYENGKNINRMELEIKYLREQNQTMMRKLGIAETIKVGIETGDLKPILGYQNLRARIADREKLSREQYEKENPRQESEV